MTIQAECPTHGESLVEYLGKLQCPKALRHSVDGEVHYTRCPYTLPLPPDMEMRATGAKRLL